MTFGANFLKPSVISGAVLLLVRGMIFRNALEPQGLCGNQTVAGGEFDSLGFCQHSQAEGAKDRIWLSGDTNRFTGSFQLCSVQRGCLSGDACTPLAVSFRVSVRGVLKSMSRKRGEMRFGPVTYLRGRYWDVIHGYRAARIPG